MHSNINTNNKHIYVRVESHGSIYPPAKCGQDVPNTLTRTGTLSALFGVGGASIVKNLYRYFIVGVDRITMGIWRDKVLAKVYHTS